MKDNVPKGTGNSRYLKSAISSSTTWEQFRTMLVNGTLPIDLNGVNAAGWQVLGDALNKANLLPDSLASALGLTGNPQVKDALAKLGSRLRAATGEYIGTGVGGAGNPCVIRTAFRPQALILIGPCVSGSYSYPAFCFWFQGVSNMRIIMGFNSDAYGTVRCTVTDSGISWYTVEDKIGEYQLNMKDRKYDYLVLG